MAFRCIVIEHPAQLSVRNSQLVIRTDAEHKVPVEDIAALLLESRQSTVTAAALSLLGQSGCALYVCDDKHLPCAVLTPYCQHSRELSVLRSQLDAGEPRKKRLWQEIVKAKIQNQAFCLRLAEKPEAADRLLQMVDRVRSGDPENLEATAARFYFPTLFGEGFTRSDAGGWNAGLNYGYAILRGCVARTLAVYGFHPALGLHHRSTLNPFNLADDLMEVLRPLTDLLVYRGIAQDGELNAAHKRMLFNCLNLDVRSGGQHHSVSYAVERLVQSLGRALENRDAQLVLPQLAEPKQHRYE